MCIGVLSECVSGWRCWIPELQTGVTCHCVCWELNLSPPEEQLALYRWAFSSARRHFLKLKIYFKMILENNKIVSISWAMRCFHRRLHCEILSLLEWASLLSHCFFTLIYFYCVCICMRVCTHVCTVCIGVVYVVCVYVGGCLCVCGVYAYVYVCVCTCGVCVVWYIV